MRTIVLAAALALSLSGTGCGYNRIQQMDERTEELEGNIEAELMRRSDLIPNLVATVEEAARFEQETQTGIAEARSGLTAARERLTNAVQGGADPGEIAAADAALSGQLRTFLNISVEAYPQLRANEGFMRLQDELTETENRIAVSRRDYNEGVREYNAYIRQFPQVLTAKVIGADRKEPFEAPESAQQAPRVDFGRDQPAPPGGAAAPPAEAPGR
jgi:LemA protein